MVVASLIGPGSAKAAPHDNERADWSPLILEAIGKNIKHLTNGLFDQGIFTNPYIVNLIFFKG